MQTLDFPVVPRRALVPSQAAAVQRSAAPAEHTRLRPCRRGAGRLHRDHRAQCVAAPGGRGGGLGVRRVAAQHQQIRPAPEYNRAVSDSHITGIATVMQGDVQRVRVPVDTEQLMSSAEMRLVQGKAPVY